MITCKTSHLVFEMGKQSSTSSADFIDEDPPKVLVAQKEIADVRLLAFLTCILPLSVVTIVRNVTVRMQRDAFDESGHCVL